MLQRIHGKLHGKTKMAHLYPHVVNTSTAHAYGLRQPQQPQQQTQSPTICANTFGQEKKLVTHVNNMCRHLVTTTCVIIMCHRCELMGSVKRMCRHVASRNVKKPTRVSALDRYARCRKKHINDMHIVCNNYVGVLLLLSSVCDCANVRARCAHL